MHVGGGKNRSFHTQSPSSAIVVGPPRYTTSRSAHRPVSSRLVSTYNHSSQEATNVSYVTVHSLHDVSSSSNSNKSAKPREKPYQQYQNASISQSPVPWMDAPQSCAQTGSVQQPSAALHSRNFSGAILKQNPAGGGVVVDRVNYVMQQQSSNHDTSDNSRNASGARVAQKLVPATVIGVPSNPRGISLAERKSSQQNMLAGGGLTSVLNVTDPASAPGRDENEDDQNEKGGPSSGYANTTQISPGDRVMITDSPDEPGVPFVYRTPEERSYNVQRLNLDKRKLEKIPVLQGEEELRLLNFQHNFIVKLERLDSFRKLVFIDLYNNRIEEIEGLDELRGLRVLMLGKNRIRAISNLQMLHKLDVLDLHGNFISEIENLNHLTELRVLNLAGNQISVVDNLAGLDSLAELNLRRNVIAHVKEIERLPVLQRLFLSFNKIESLNDVQSLSGSQSLLEVTLDANPVSDNYSMDLSNNNPASGRMMTGVNSCSGVTYRQKLICQIPNLRQLDMKRISDEERRGALMASRKEEEKLKEVARSQAMKEKKRAAIANAAKQWDELMRQHQELSATPTSVLLQQSRHSNKASRTSGNNSNKLPALDVHPGSSTGSAAGGGAGGMSSRADSARSRTSNLEDRLSDSMGTMNEGRGSQKHSVGTFTGSSGVPSSGGECDISSYHLADLDGETLNLYGTGAIPALDRNWGVQAASHVTTISFRFIDFDQISPHFPKMRARFPNIHTLIFEETNLKHLNQLNALAQLRKLDHLVVKSNGNPLVTNMRLWKYYALHRLSQFSIRKINDKAVTSEELMEAEKLFGDLVSLVNTSAVTANQQVAGSSSATPRANSADISRGKRNPLTSSDSDLKRVTVHGSVPSRGGFCNPLQFVPEDRKLMMENEAVCAKSVASKVVTGSVRDALSIEHKQRVLDNTWDKLFNQLVASYAAQMLDYRNYVQKHLKEIDIVDI